MSGGTAETCASGLKAVKKTFKAVTRKEGAGFVVRRPVGGGELTDEEADPFLLLDELPRTHYAPGSFQCLSLPLPLSPCPSPFARCCC
eukprot:243843-Rhodomonas_salina.1